MLGEGAKELQSMEAENIFCALVLLWQGRCCHFITQGSAGIPATAVLISARERRLLPWPGSITCTLYRVTRIAYSRCLLQFCESKPRV